MTIKLFGDVTSDEWVWLYDLFSLPCCSPKTVRDAIAQLQKPIKNPGALGGKNKKAYYPASQEYGFLARAPGGGVQYVEGLHFMRDAAEQVSPQAKQTMIDVMETELDKLWKEAAH